MNRRPKLDLSSEQKVNKKRPSGFSGSSNDETETPASSGQTQYRPQQEQINHSQEAETSLMAQWLDGKRLLKVALVVAAAGLSLYLLKRRLY